MIKRLFLCLAVMVSVVAQKTLTKTIGISDRETQCNGNFFYISTFLVVTINVH